MSDRSPISKPRRISGAQPGADLSTEAQEVVCSGVCARVRSGFSAYLDGAISGVDMAAISTHLDICKDCGEDFQAWREIQRVLGELGPAHPPPMLRARLSAAIAEERERGSYLPLHRRALLLWRSSIEPQALQLSRGLAAAVMLAGGLCWMFGAPITVQANDDAMAHLVAPHYLYSQVPPELIGTHRDAPVVVEAMVDSNGRAYDYFILEGPRSPRVRASVENNLLGSVFEPATVFGVPVRGHVVMIYTGVSVRG